ncbi:hypothetical protein AZH53_07145 [Methanomicrobiaceae archaeon CYW5]|uniref:hypothetical protein n=1 Tax=Methanovulcanius yangii TaxID=1789227 RepID=UPI0029CA1DDF|nr:hypothetical protein [Methanovulcanius yangii]MBT8508179.1 hypothetical protein [Methanovulcanius yangii]
MAIAVPGFFTPGTVSARYPSVPVGSASPEFENVSYTFPYATSIHTIEIPVDRTIFMAAAKTPKYAVVYGKPEMDMILAGYYHSFVHDKAQGQVYEAAVVPLRSIRDREHLTMDEYAELITVFVQSIPFDHAPDNPAPKFPVETLLLGTGDCDDKTILLTGLLAHEGYDTAILVFREDAHTAAGIRCDDALAWYAGYAYTETTEFSLIGLPADALGGNVTITGAPVIIPVGNGTTAYHATDETTYLGRRAMEARAAIPTLRSRIAEMEQAIASGDTYLSGMLEMMNAAAAADNNTALCRAEEEYLAGLEEHRALTGTCESLRAELNRNIFLHDYILANQHNRAGTYAHVRTIP